MWALNWDISGNNLDKTTIPFKIAYNWKYSNLFVKTVTLQDYPWRVKAAFFILRPKKDT